MAVLNRYSTGNTVYRGSSSAPTRGKVDPMGYLDRESRSKLAANALKRRLAPIPTISNARKPVPVAKPKPVAKPVAKPAVPRPTIVANPTGQYIPYKPAPLPVVQRAPIDMSKYAALFNTNQIPFDEDIALSQNQLDQDKIDFMSQFDSNRFKLDQYKTDALRSIDTQSPEVMNSILENFAARGMARSSGYGTAVGDAQKQFADARTGIDKEYTGGINDLNLAKSNFDRRYTQTSGALTTRAAALAAERAGLLNLQKQYEAEVAEQNAPLPESPIVSAAQAPKSAPVRQPTRVELVLQETARGVSPTVLAKKYGLSGAAIAKIIATKGRK